MLKIWGYSNVQSKKVKTFPKGLNVAWYRRSGLAFRLWNTGCISCPVVPGLPLPRIILRRYLLDLELFVSVVERFGNFVKRFPAGLIYLEKNYQLQWPENTLRIAKRSTGLIYSPFIKFYKFT